MADLAQAIADMPPSQYATPEIRFPAAQAKTPKVAIAYVHDDDGRVTSFEESLLALVTYENSRGGRLNHDMGRMPIRYGTDGLPAARNTVAAALVQSDVDWLLWVDTDMGFAPDALERLLAVADPAERPVVGGLCFIQRQYAHDGMNGYRTRPTPSIFDWREDPETGSPRFLSVPMYPVNAVIQVAATGAAFILIHRSVLEKIAEAHGPTWYDRTHGGMGELLGEDISFCVRAATVGAPIHVHTGVRTSHYKNRWLAEADHWRGYVPPPAAERVAVIVPVLGRPEHAEPFMRSLRASTGLATAYAVVERDDLEAAEAWRTAGAELLWGDDEFIDGAGHAAHTFAEKCNLAYRQTLEPWLLLVGSDVKFHPGWLDHALHVADTLGGSVIGTNDLGNPRVMAGDHAVHPLVRRSYVDEVGASWDGPKVVAHEGYRHWFVDDELVTAAKQRGVWQMALGSVVEHLHPIFGKGEQDDVYELGQGFAERDKALFLERYQANS